MDDKLLLIDGHSILNRAFYAISNLSNSEGLHTNAIYGFLKTLLKIIDDEKPKYLCVAFDMSAPTFRHKLYSKYKGTRKKMPDELREQVPVLIELLKSMNIMICQKEGLEADDIIGTIANYASSNSISVAILSGDRDLLQLSKDNVCIIMPKTSKGSTTITKYYKEDVLREYFVDPINIIDLKALMGDTSDNIPGIAGIGEKSATKLLVEYKTLDNIYNNIDLIKPDGIKSKLIKDKDNAYLSYKLATIDINANFEFNIEEMILNNLFNENSFRNIKKLEFKGLYDKFSNLTIESSKEIKKYSYNLYELSDINGYKNFKLNLKEAKDVSISIVDSLQNQAVQINSREDIISITINKEDVYFIRALEGQIKEISSDINNALKNKTHLITNNLQQLLKYINIDIKFIENIDDISLMAYNIDSNIKDIYKIENILKNDVPINYDKMKIEEKNAINSILIFEAYSKIYKKIKDNNLEYIYNNIDKPLAFVLCEIENNGIRVDKVALDKYDKYLNKEISVLEKEIYKEAEEEFNINSPKQLGYILFEKMEIEPVKKTKTGYSTDSSVLEYLSKKHKIASLIIKYRMYTKISSTYAKGLQRYIDSKGRIHSNFNQCITATGRISSSDPNLQNIPIREKIGQKIREVFIPKDGYVFIDADYSQIELRVMANLSKDKKMISAFNQNKDIHNTTASEIFNVNENDVSSDQRRNAKAVNFGVIYGISDFGLSNDIGIDIKSAKEFIDGYFKTYPDIKKYLDETVDFAIKNGYVKTYYGRIRKVPEINNSNYNLREFGKRVAMNSPIQGTAADIMKIAMIGVYNKFRELNLESKLILQVHDELLIEAKKSEINIVKKILKEKMEECFNFDVKLSIDIKEGSNWLEAH